MNKNKLKNELNAKNLPVIKLTDDVPTIAYENLERLAEMSKKANLIRSRICAHKSEQDDLQNMFIYFDGKYQVEPAKHADKDESIHMLQGRCRYFFFNENGGIDYDVRLGDYSSDLPFYLKVPKNVMHCLVPISENILAHETAQGPFNPNLTQYQNNRYEQKSQAEWLEYSDKLIYLHVHAIEPLEMLRKSENVYQCISKFIYVRRADIELLKEEVLYLRKKIIKVIMASSDESSNGLFEEIVIYAEKDTLNSKTQNSHDKAFHVIEGGVKFDIYNKDGAIEKEIHLSGEDQKNIFIRIPKQVQYSMCKTSNFLVTHESSIR